MDAIDQVCEEDAVHPRASGQLTRRRVKRLLCLGWHRRNDAAEATAGMGAAMSLLA